MLGKAALKTLEPLLDGEGPDNNGEWPMHCPYHGDRRRSASINIENELWFCHGCGEKGEGRDLVRDKDNWVLANGNGHKPQSSQRPAETITEATLDGWHAALLSNRAALRTLKQKRGLTLRTVKMYQIGWDHSAAKGEGAYTIPIRDMAGELVNVRRYQPNPTGDRRKIWSVDGMGTPTLFPCDQMENDAIVICEGEMDALLTIQNGIPAVTRTGTADHWKPEWSQLFRGKRVYICHDMDKKGQHANRKISAELRRKADSITVVTLPYEETEKDGMDLTDFWMEGHSRADFLQLIRQGEVIQSLKERLGDEEEALRWVSVMDSFDGSLVEMPLAMQVTVTGKRIPSYLVISEAVLGCNVDAGKKCEYCALQQVSGEMPIKIPAESPLILSMVEAGDQKVREAVREAFGIAKCSRWEIRDRQHRTVEEIYVRPSIETTGGGHQDFTHRKVISAATHDLSSNQTVDLVGTIRPNPKNSTNEFQAWNVRKPPNTLDTFALTDEMKQRLKKFQSDDPLGKLYDIADDMAAHTTKIYMRPEMHIFMDLTFHSALQIQFSDTKDTKGWMDCIILGDTRTGKSEAALRMLELYGMGEMVSCESATYAGVVGGLDRTADNRWIVKWGAVPINDKRIVVLDEVSGLQPEQISQMTNIRSSGVAEMTKIQSEHALARTRLLWLANPRSARMDDFTFGVHALQPLIGNNEDMSRFDMVMGVFSHEVGAEEINKGYSDSGERRYDEQSLRELLRWAWTLEPKDIVFKAATEKMIFDQATELGKRYMEVPPLVQGADARKKLARISTAVAIRTFNINARGQCVVEPKHVEATVAFLHEIYGNVSFGYGVISEQKAYDHQETLENIDKIMEYIVARPGLSRFLKHTPVFDRYAIETVMNVSREASSAMINEMWGMKAVVFEEGKLKLNPEVVKKIRVMTHE